MTSVLRSSAPNRQTALRQSTTSVNHSASTPGPSRRRRRSSRYSSSRHQASATAPTSSVVSVLPQPAPMPLWLTLLVMAQRGSSVVTFILIAAVLTVYSWTVYAQQRWGQAYRHLESLQKQERQLIATNEVLKNQMARQAEKPDVGLILPDPSTRIFLSPAPQRPEVEPDILPSSTSPQTRPMGY